MKIHGTAKGGAISKKDFGVAFGISFLDFTTTCFIVNPDGDRRGLPLG